MKNRKEKLVKVVMVDEWVAAPPRTMKAIKELLRIKR